MSNYYLCAECAHKRQLWVGTGEVDCRAMPGIGAARVIFDGGAGVGYQDPLDVCLRYVPRGQRYAKPRIAESLGGLTGKEDA